MGKTYLQRSQLAVEWAEFKKAKEKAAAEQKINGATNKTDTLLAPPATKIDWATKAKPMINAYRNNSNALTVTVINPQNNQPEEKRLNGFKLTKANILDIFSNPAADELFIMLGVSYADLGQTNDDDQHFTFIVAGIANNQVQTNITYDFCDPCPDKCPTNIDSILS